jgi:hypothetical protein
MEETSGDYRPRYFPQFLFVVPTRRLLYLSLERKTEERDQCHAYRPRSSAATSFLRQCTFRFGDTRWLAVTASSSSTAARGTASTSIRTSLPVLLHSINSPRRFRNVWRSAQNDDPAGHPHRGHGDGGHEWCDRHRRALIFALGPSLLNGSARGRRRTSGRVSFLLSQGGATAAPPPTPQRLGAAGDFQA